MTVYFIGAGPGAEEGFQAKWVPVRRFENPTTREKGAP